VRSFLPHISTTAPIPVGANIAAIAERSFSTSTPNDQMASDADYASFLEKANQDPSEGVAKSEGVGKAGGFKATDKGVVVPTVLKKAVVDAFYTSDADEPFEVVGLKFEGGKLPDEGMFLSSSIPLPIPVSIAIWGDMRTGELY